MFKKIKQFYLSHNHQTAFVVSAIVLFWPLGLYLMWKHRKWSFRARSVITSIFLLFTLFSGIGIYNAPPYIILADETVMNGIKTDEAYTVVKGEVSTLHEPTVKINDQPVTIDTYGAFSHKLPLKEGDTTVVIVSSSVKGTDTKRFTVHRTTAAEFAERERIAKQKKEKEAAVRLLADQKKQEQQAKAKAAQELKESEKAKQAAAAETESSANSSSAAPASTPAPAPAPAPAPQPAQSGCDPNYSPCVPHSSTDLNCKDIGFMVRVIGSDPHGFDSNGDGLGCESYG